jgi:hypothetical protein
MVPLSKSLRDLACEQYGIDDMNGMMKEEIMSQSTDVIDYKHWRYPRLPHGTSGLMIYFSFIRLSVEI